jgi:UDP-N-acetylmuramate dehydrogenase
MNAGGKFGTISDHLVAVHAMDRAGRMHELSKSDIDFSYRHSGLNHLIVCSAVFRLEHADPVALKHELSECMKYKTDSQPMSAKSAGCAFKNPTLNAAIEGIGEAGDRVSAGMLIDRAGCKGMQHDGASVSDLHANFITTTPDACARDVITLMKQVKERVHGHFGVQLDNEVVIWTRDEEIAQ